MFDNFSLFNEYSSSIVSPWESYREMPIITYEEDNFIKKIFDLKLNKTGIKTFGFKINTEHIVNIILTFAGIVFRPKLDPQFFSVLCDSGRFNQRELRRYANKIKYFIVEIDPDSKFVFDSSSYFPQSNHIYYRCNDEETFYTHSNDNFIIDILHTISDSYIPENYIILNNIEDYSFLTEDTETFQGYPVQIKDYTIFVLRKRDPLYTIKIVGNTSYIQQHK